jgi:hypothetical protein
MRAVILKVLFGVIAGVPVLSWSSSARAQAFAGGTPTAFTPEIGIVSTGTVNDVQATVSADEKYVTLTMRPQVSTLEALRTFTFQQGNTALGYVGMPETATANGSTTARSNSQSTPWVSARPSVSILQRKGMIQVSKAPAPSNPGPANAR